MVMKAGNEYFFAGSLSFFLRAPQSISGTEGPAT